MDELLRNLSPAIMGLIVAGAGLLFARHERRKAARRREAQQQAAGPAE
jgi:hypothetical protein